MSDFVSEFWSYFVAVLTVASILICGIVLKIFSTRLVVKDKPVETMGHVWDGDLEEYNNPLPAWWKNLFYITLVFSFGYLVLFPGLGSFQGVLNWSSKGQFDEEANKAQAKYGPLFEKFAKTDLVVLSNDYEARMMGQRLFLTYCAQCHGSDARGAKGFPNLTDKDWLYGGEPETIKTTILNGRNGIMPPFGQVLGEAGVKATANYVLTLAGKGGDPVLSAKGKELFAANCAACHGPEGKGTPAMGAPNLTDNVWLYGGSETTLIETIAKGRNNMMPAQKEFLGEAKVHLLAAYVLGLNKNQ